MTNSPLGVKEDQLYLLIKVARLYHERRLRQPEIAQRLHISQPRVSRLLKLAEESGIVRTSVVVPKELYANLEDELETRYGLLDAHVVDLVSDDEESAARELGAAAAVHVAPALFGFDVIGFSSWSRPLLAMVDFLRPTHRPAARYIVEMLGDLGHPVAQLAVAQATQKLAELTGAEAVLLRTPGLAPSAALRAAIVAQDIYVQRGLAMLERVQVALVGIGSVTLSELLHRSGAILEPKQVVDLQERGAAGNINLRFFDGDGRVLASPVDDRVIGMTLTQLRHVERSIAVSGGPGKAQAVRGALIGGWIDVLVTDTATAQTLLAEAPSTASTVRASDV
jgi:DNA-binding transcriptional regulator LsrR (DeoR family)